MQKVVTRLSVLICGLVFAIGSLLLWANREKPPLLTKNRWTILWNQAEARQITAERENGAHQQVTRQWLARLDPYKNETIVNKLRQVARQGKALQSNERADEEIYHSAEYFAAPYELIENGAGDCEDFAILNYHALRYLGLADKDLGLGLADSNGKKAPDHCVLLVSTEDKQMYVLSNNSDPMPVENYQLKIVAVITKNRNSHSDPRMIEVP